jgi:hypothetical protein
MRVTRVRKRPVTVDAAPWDGTVAGATAVIDWVLANGGTARYHDESEPGGCAIAIDTLEGTMTALPGSWVIRGVAGEFHPVRGDIFERTYDPADAAEPAGDSFDREAADLLASALDVLRALAPRPGDSVAGKAREVLARARALRADRELLAPSGTGSAPCETAREDNAALNGAGS